MTKVLRYLGIGYTIYIALSLLIIFPVLNLMAPRLAESELGREFRASVIVFNPFTVALDVRNGEFYNPDGSFFLGWRKVSVNISLSSIWSQGLVFDAIELDSLHAEVERAVDGTFNFADLLSDSKESVESAPAPPLPGVTIHHLALHAEKIGFTDNAREPRFTTYIRGIDIAIDDISTVHESDEPYSLHAKAEAGGELYWAGQISLPSANSTGTLSLKDINLIAVSRFLEPWVNFRLPSGRLEIGGEYSIDWKNELTYRVAEGRLALTGVSIAAQHTDLIPDTSLSFDTMNLTDIALDSTEQRLDANALTVSGLEVAGWSEGNRVSLVEMLTPAASGESDDNAVVEDHTPGWSVTLASADIIAATTQWRSQYTSPELLSLSPIDVHVGALEWPAIGSSELDVSIVINGQATLAINGGINIGKGDGLLQYNITDLPLSWFNPNLPQALDATIGQGLTEAEGALALIEFAPTQIDSTGSITDFAIKVAEADDAITRWKSVRWTGVSVSLPEQDLSLKSLTINGYSGRLHVYSDGSINAQRLLRENNSEPVSEVEIATDTRPWTFSVPSISIVDSQIDFMDESLPIQFRTIIGDLHGNISNLNSQAGVSTSVNLAGSVDGYAPVLLTGSASPFKELPELDLSLSFKGMDIAGLTPYTGNYAGYAIDRGILNIDLAYTLENSHLVGANRIIIEQLKLGDKVDSEQAVDLPLGLAIALLTDLNGVIDIDLPISGDVASPEFSIGSVVFGALVNLITKAVTAPFSLLAGLIGSADDFQRINFDSGSAVLNERMISQLDALTEALRQRPGLMLTIGGRLELDRDTQMLARKLFDQSLVSNGLSEEQIGQRGQPWQEAITTAYVKLDNAMEPADIDVELQYKALVKTIEVDRDTLNQLLQERASAVKRYLITEAGIEVGRAVIESTAIDDVSNVFSGAELGLSN